MGDALGWLWFLVPMGVGVLSLREYKFAKACFLVSETVLAAKVLMEIHERAASVSVLWKAVITFAACGVVGLAVFFSWQWVDRKRHEDSLAAQPTNSAPESPKPQQPGSETPAPAPHKKTPAPHFAPAGFIRFIGQVINGKAAMMQENQTQTPLDNVHLSVILSAPNSAADWEHGAVLWQKEIEVGTVRALLTSSLPERFPVPSGQPRLVYYIVMMTRLRTYTETIKVEKIDDKHYSVHYEFQNAEEPYSKDEHISIAD